MTEDFFEQATRIDGSFTTRTIKPKSDKRLVSNPKYQQQPKKNACVPTCLAMAFGIPAEEVVSEFEEMFDINFKERGVWMHELSEYLTKNGIGGCPSTYHHKTIPKYDGVFLMFRFINPNSCHCYLLTISKGSVSLLDPGMQDDSTPLFILDGVDNGFKNHMKLLDFSKEGE